MVGCICVVGKDHGKESQAHIALRSTSDVRNEEIKNMALVSQKKGRKKCKFGEAHSNLLSQNHWSGGPVTALQVVLMHRQFCEPYSQLSGPHTGTS